MHERGITYTACSLHAGLCQTGPAGRTTVVTGKFYTDKSYGVLYRPADWSYALDSLYQSPCGVAAQLGRVIPRKG